MTKNRTPTPVYLDPGMHPGLEVEGLSIYVVFCDILIISKCVSLIECSAPLDNSYAVFCDILNSSGQDHICSD